MKDHILKAYEADIKIRTEGLQHANKTGYKVNVHEVSPGVIYRDQNVTVRPSPYTTAGLRRTAIGLIPRIER